MQTTQEYDRMMVGGIIDYAYYSYSLGRRVVEFIHINYESNTSISKLLPLYHIDYRNLQVHACFRLNTLYIDIHTS